MDEIDHRALLKELGQDSTSKREGDLMDFIQQQQSNDDRGNDDDDWEDALALRSFLKLPRHAKVKLTQGSGEPISVFSDGSHHNNAVHGHRRETAVGRISSQFGLGDAMLDGKSWHKEESVKNVELKMEEHRDAGSSSGSLAIDLFANSELTTEHIEEKSLVDEFGIPLEVYKKDDETGEGEYGLSSWESGAFSGSSSSVRGASRKNASETFRADFIAQRALMKKVAKEHVSVTEKLEAAERGISEAAKHRIIECFRRTIRGYQKKTRMEMLHRGWRHWKLFYDSFDHVRRGIEEGKYKMSLQALEIRKKRRNLREWRRLVDREKYKRRYFVTQCEKLNTRMCRDALYEWRQAATEAVKSRTEYNFVVTALRKRLQKMRGNNTDLRWAWGRWHLMLVDLRNRDASLVKALEIATRKTSLVSWALRRWREKLITYPMQQMVAYHEGALQLELVMRKKRDLQLRQKMLRGFQIWAFKVAHIHSINQYTFSVLNSLLSSLKRRILHSRLLHWSREVRYLRYRAERLYIVLKLATHSSHERACRNAFARWLHCCKYTFDIQAGSNALERRMELMFRLKARAAEALFDRRFEAAEHRLLVSSWMAWKRRNFTQSRLRTRRALVLSSLRRSRLVTAMMAHALRRWRDVVLCTVIQESKLLKMSHLLSKLHKTIHFAKWRAIVRRIAAYQCMGRWLVISRRIFRLTDSRKAFFRWRSRVKADIHAERTLSRLFFRIPKVVYRSTLRRWSTRISRMKQYKANRLAIREPFDTWCKYTRYWISCKMRLDYVAHMASKSAKRYVWTRWVHMYRDCAHKLGVLKRCVDLREGVVRLFKQRSLSHWRNINYKSNGETIENLGRATSLALKRVVSSEQTIEEQTIQSSFLQSRIRASLEYQQFLLSHTCHTLATRARDLKKLYPSFHAWRRFVMKKVQHLHAVRSLLRNRRRIQVRHILGRRFLRWKRVLEFSMASSIAERVKHGRFIVLMRRSRLSLLGFVFKKWKNRGQRFHLQLLGTFRRLTRQRCRRRLAKAWLRWSRHIFASRMVEGNLRRCVTMRRIFFSWHRMVVITLLKRTSGHQQALRLLRSRRKGLKVGSLKLWQEFTHKRIHGRRKWNKVFLCFRRAVVVSALNTWRRNAAHLTAYLKFTWHLCGLMHRIESGHKMFRISSAFSSWRLLLAHRDSETVKTRYRREALKNIISSWDWHSCKGPKLRSFHHWRRVINEVSKHQFIVEGHYYHSVREKTERTILRWHFDAWLKCPRMQRALPLRSARAGAGLAAIQNVLQKTHGFQRDLYSEVANERSPSTALKIVMEALLDAFPLYLPSVYLLTSDGSTLRGLVACHHHDIIMGDDVAVEAPPITSSSDSEPDDCSLADSTSESDRRADERNREEVTAQYPRKGSAASQIFPRISDGADADTGADADADVDTAAARFSALKSVELHSSGVYMKVHSLQVGQGRVGGCAKRGRAEVYIDRASEAPSAVGSVTILDMGTIALPQETEGERVCDVKGRHTESEDGEISAKTISSEKNKLPKVSRRVSLSNSALIQPFSKEEPPVQTLQREEVSVRMKNASVDNDGKELSKERRFSAPGLVSPPQKPPKPARRLSGGVSTPPKPPKPQKGAPGRSASLSPAMLRSGSSSTSTSSTAALKPPLPAMPLPERRHTMMGELMQKRTPPGRRQSLYRHSASPEGTDVDQNEPSESTSQPDLLSSSASLDPLDISQSRRATVAGSVPKGGVAKVHPGHSRSRSVASMSKGTRKSSSMADTDKKASEEEKKRDKERAEAIIFPLIRFGRVIGVLCLNHRMLHEKDATTSTPAYGEWVVEPPSLSSSNKSSTRTRSLYPSQNTKRKSNNFKEGTDDMHAAALGGDRMRGVLTFVASQLGLTLAQSTTLSALVFTTVDVFATYFSVSGIRARSRKPRKDRMQGAPDRRMSWAASVDPSSSEYEDSGSDGLTELEDIWYTDVGSRLAESKRDTLRRMEATMKEKEMALQRELAEVQGIKDTLHRQVLLEQSHSQKVEHRYMSLEQELGDTTAHISDLVSERDRYRDELHEVVNEHKRKEKEMERELERLTVALNAAQKDNEKQRQQLDEAKDALKTAHIREEAAQETRNQMHKLHSVLQAASEMLSASDDENEKPSTPALGGSDWGSRGHSDEDSDPQEELLVYFRDL